ncbi:MAG: hypothetical protein ACOYEL_02890 [Saccharofermentanales bacterium]|jgi:hypothetical protein
MTFLLIIILVLTVLLMLIGTMSNALSLTLIGISVGALAFLTYRNLHLHYYAFKKQQKLGGKWAGNMRYISGITGRVSDSCFLFLTGQKDLVLDDMQTDLVIRSDELVRLCVIEAALLAQINDREIAEMMEMETHPALHAVRSWLIRNPEAKRHYIMMLYLIREIENMPQKGELVFFSDVEGRGHIKELLRQPDIAVKAMLIPKGTTIEELYPTHDKESIRKKIHYYGKSKKALPASKHKNDENTEPFSPLS